MHAFNHKQYTIQNCILFLFDMIALCASYFLALATRGIISDFIANTQYYTLVLFFAIIICLISYALFDLNSHFLSRNKLAEFFFVLKYDVMIGAGLGLFLFLTQNAQDFSRLAFAYFLVYNFILCFLFHLFVKFFLTGIYIRSASSSKMLVVTETSHLNKLMEQLSDSKEWSHEITAIGLIDSTKTIAEDPTLQYHSIPVIAGNHNLYSCLNEHVLDEVLIYLPNYNTKKISQMIRKFEMAGLIVHVSIDPYDHIISNRTMNSFAGLSVMTYRLSDYNFHRIIIKRLMDISISFVGLLLTLLLTPFIAIAIKWDSKGPVFYRQKRIGLNGREFHILKFRSMYADADEKKDELLSENEMTGPIFKITDDPRITKVGKFLRTSSLDELPQFFNILIGQMSLVGTRPPTPDEYVQYKLQYRRRLSIKPGLTGLWQVSGRSNITDFEDILRLDLHYIDHWSLGMDIKILFQTFGVVLSKKGAK